MEMIFLKMHLFSYALLMTSVNIRYEIFVKIIQFLMTSVNIRDEIFKDAFINISYDQCKYKR